MERKERTRKNHKFDNLLPGDSVVFTYTRSWHLWDKKVKSEKAWEYTHDVICYQQLEINLIDYDNSELSVIIDIKNKEKEKSTLHPIV